MPRFDIGEGVEKDETLWCLGEPSRRHVAKMFVRSGLTTSEVEINCHEKLRRNVHLKANIHAHRQEARRQASTQALECLARTQAS